MNHITLAPMEGVVDYLLRELLSEIGGIDLCVTEFIRVTDTRLPTSVFHRICPELKHGCQTRAGTPVHIQFLGNNPQLLALNAAKAAEIGARGIDLNFGCPAKTVCRHKGGAILLQEPELIHDIVKAIRKAVPDEMPVTAKIRLGYLDGDLAIDNAKAIEDAGANGLAVHARTKLQGYKPPAYWEDIVAIREAVDIPVVANGDIFSVEDARRCREITGCQRIMVGRGVLRNPGLPKAIASSTADKHHCDEQHYGEQRWHQSLDILQRFTRKVVQVAEYPEADHPYGINNPKRYLDGRLKQWLSMMSKTSEQARQLFEQIKRETCIRGMSEKVYRAT
ncbi:tRNA dihydrouridine synthase [Endozoicomonas euniceicola]|uniref:tRNA-dihydrouridine(16) synthase n=1 Tax=Endozoicomonas euniceicola TaxID=1234143 RepID=A0ABY6GYA9_9GAMM|nr:tRNA-dihydrouridine synthase [Endozoicomonas euniceicola]UYM16993.1 tRNA-dihydrouridine synthase [Endozoicomonas euniceicola]